MTYIYMYIYLKDKYIYSFGGNFYFYLRETFTNTSNIFTQERLCMSTTPESTCIIILYFLTGYTFETE